MRAVPGSGLNLPIWLLGSSTFSAQLAGRLGLPFAFAGQFSPDYMHTAFQTYRQHFESSASLEAPHVMLGINAYVAHSGDEAAMLATSHQQAFLNLIRGRPGPLPPPVEDMSDLWLPHERHSVLSTLAGTLVGDELTVAQQLAELLERTGANELIVNSSIFDQTRRAESYRLLHRTMHG